MRFSTLPKVSTAILLAFFGLALIAPLPYAIITPGHAVNVFDGLITKSKSSTAQIEFTKADGELLLLTILVTNPDSYVSGGFVIYSWLRSDNVVLPKSAIYTPGLSVKDEEIKSTKEMTDSQLSAKVAALAYLNKVIPTGNYSNIKPEDISISLADTGGPSAGAAFALGLVELLSKENYLHGKKIAVTGTIDTKGRIGAIGGVNEKLIAAKQSHADLLVIPKDNCADLDSIPQGIKVAAVSTLTEAIEALNSKDPKGCANVGA
jgi:PDZ domain-containing protein